MVTSGCSYLNGQLLLFVSVCVMMDVTSPLSLSPSLYQCRWIIYSHSLSRTQCAWNGASVLSLLLSHSFDQIWQFFTCPPPCILADCLLPGDRYFILEMARKIVWDDHFLLFNVFRSNTCIVFLHFSFSLAFTHSVWERTTTLLFFISLSPTVCMSVSLSLIAFSCGRCACTRVHVHLHSHRKQFIKWWDKLPHVIYIW